MKGSHSPIRASQLDSLWALPRTKADWMAAIEEIIERGATCASFIADELMIPSKKVEGYLREMVKEKILQKDGKIMVGKQQYLKYKIFDENPKQASLINEPVARDWLVAAFFGEYKPCVTI